MGVLLRDILILYNCVANVIAQQVCLVFVLRVHLLLVSGDIESNPGPTRYLCKLCSKPMRKNHRALCCFVLRSMWSMGSSMKHSCDDCNEDQWFCSVCSGDSYPFELRVFWASLVAKARQQRNNNRDVTVDDGEEEQIQDREQWKIHLTLIMRDSLNTFLQQ